MAGVWLVAMMLFLFSGCDVEDKSYKKQDGYVEVTALRIESAQVYMATSGDPSTYQVEAEIVPANATNRKLSYYIPSEYYEYVTVDAGGLLTAHQVTEGFSVPLTVRSTSNKDAKLTVNVTVEDIAVKRLAFTEDKVSLLYNGEPEEVFVTYSPYHAVEGRNLTYKSLNENVARVAVENGRVMVYPVGQGQTRIQAVSRPTGSLEQIEAYIAVHVNYAKAQYKLAVSGTPRWTQVVGDFSPINFTLMIMGENVDPEPSIEWYVGTERDMDASDRRQYSHTPSQTTQITYNVKVVVAAKTTQDEKEVVSLYSDDIVIYNDFAGFSLDYKNFSHAYTGYQYGETVRFALQESPSSSTDHYDWTLNKLNGDGTKMKIASTPVSDRDLVRVMNVVGDYYLTVTAKDVNDYDLSTATSFTFNAERLVEGDTLVVNPVLLEGGLPPDSYHWYVVECNENGDYDLADKKKIADTGRNETFYYPLEKSGLYRLVVTSSTDGVLSTVANDQKERETYTYVGDVLRVYKTDDRLADTSASLVPADGEESHAFAVSNAVWVQDVIIEGIQTGGESLLYLHWNTSSDVDKYVLEFVFEDGTVKIMDSAEYPASFGAHFVTVPKSVATLTDKFSVRIKQKDSLYSQAYSYGIPTISGGADETHTLTFPTDVYSYFANVSTNNNLYVTTTEELFRLVQYILLYTPTQNANVQKGNEQIGGVLYDTFGVRYYSAIGEDVLKAYASAYCAADASLQTDAKKQEFATLVSDKGYAYLYEYLTVLGVQKQGAFRTECLFDLEKNGNVCTLVIKVPNNRSTKLKTTEAVNFDTATSIFYAEKPYYSTSISFLVSGKDQVLVHTSDQLVYVMESGLNPVPSANDDLATLYKTIKSVYVSVVGVGSDDVEKVLAFYDWLCLNVRADEEEENMEDLSEYDRYQYDSYRLEGVFNSAIVTSIRGKANSFGIAKAFSVLCGLAGIPCKTCVATVDGKTEAYNRVFVDNAWYIVDATRGRKTAESGIVYVDHFFFLTSDEKYVEAVTGEETVYAVFGEYPSAENVYSKEIPVIGSDKNLEDLFFGITGEGRVAMEIACKDTYCATEEEFLSAIDGMQIIGREIVEVCKIEGVEGLRFAIVSDAVKY